MYPTRTASALALALSLVACSDAPTTAAPEANTNLSPAAASDWRGRAHAPSTALINSPLTDAAGNVVGSFTGSVRLAEVALDGQNLIGRLVLDGKAVVNGEGTRVKKVIGTGTLFTGTGGTVGAVARSGSGAMATADIGIQQIGSCPILDLTIGAIHLNLLGLDVVLATVNLDIVAIPGSGALLGNLLCIVVHLLDGPIVIGGPLGVALTNLINIINQLLGGLL